MVLFTLSSCCRLQEGGSGSDGSSGRRGRERAHNRPEMQVEMLRRQLLPASVVLMGKPGLPKG